MKEDATMVQARQPPSGFPSFITIVFGWILEFWKFGFQRNAKARYFIMYSFRIPASNILFMFCSLFSKVFFCLGSRSCFPGLVPVSLVTLFTSCVLPLCLGACAPTAPRELRCPPLLHLFIDTGRPHSKCFASNPSLQMTREVHPGRTEDCNALPSTG